MDRISWKTIAIVAALIALALGIPSFGTRSAMGQTTTTIPTRTPTGGQGITGIDPASGPPGTVVFISGTNLSRARAVRFNGVSASIRVISNTRIRTVVPRTATSGPITVTTPQNELFSPVDFTVIAPPPVPTISGFTPPSGQVGSMVTINGTGLTGATAVTFTNNKAATFTVVSDTQIDAMVPAGATTGRIRVTTPGGTASSPTGFQVTLGPRPTISGFSPTNGVVGTTVIINGANFTGATRVLFSDKSATFTVVSDSQIQAVVPSGAVTGKVKVRTAAGTGTSADNFIVPLAPRITGFTPTAGSEGTQVVITGRHFVPGYTTVMFGTTAATPLTVTQSRITVLVPAGAGTGLVKISVTTDAGTVVSRGNFRLR